MNKLRLTMCLLMTMLMWPSHGICPSGKFLPCAQSGHWCDIPANTEGYLSYGGEGKYTLTPFKTYYSGSRVGCFDNWGDMLYGRRKWCCYLKTKLDINTNTGYSRFGSENRNRYTQYSLTNQTARFGVSGKAFLYFPSDGTSVMRCNYANLGYWLAGFPKVCDSTHGVQPSMQALTNDWSTCGSNNQMCSGLEVGGVHWVRMGANGKYVTKLVTTSDGTFPCKMHLFREDAAPGQPKFCQAMPALISFSSLVGKWVRIQSCGGLKCVGELSVTEGITKTKATTITNSWTNSLTLTMSSGLKFENGHSQETTLSTTMSHTLTNSIQNSLTESKQVTRSFSCEGDAMYQWVVGANRLDLVSTKSFEIRSADFYCINDPLTPQCPPKFCKDTNCQTCTQKLNSFFAVNDEHAWEDRKNLDKMVVYMLVGVVILLLACGGRMVAGCVSRASKRQSYQEIRNEPAGKKKSVSFA